MDNNAYLLIGLALVSLLLLFANKQRSPTYGRGRLRLPPGPWQLPIIGSLHHIAGKAPHRALRELARRHGPVMMLRLGEVQAVVMSSREAAIEVMKTQDLAFASRPQTATVRVITKEGRDIAFAPYGEHWRQLRKVAITELLSVRRVLSFRAVREDEVAAMLRDVAEAAAASRPVEMRARLAALVSDTTLRAVVGERWKHRDVFLRELSCATELVAGFNLADLWPSSWLAGRLSGVLPRAQACIHRVYGLLDGVIEEHLRRDGGRAGHEDLIDVLLRLQKDGELPRDMDVVKAVIFDIFGAGSDTSATTLEWALAELVRNPKVMRKAQAEVREAFGDVGRVREQALGELQYLPLVVRETLRLHAPAPLLLPRLSRKPCRVLGYDVPEGTMVLVNIWALARDERHWPNAPEEFRPDRYQCESRGVDLKGTNFELLPFGAGRRICPGLAFGLANIELALASLLFHFDWEVPGLSDPTDLDMTDIFSANTRRKADLPLRPILRVPVPDVDLVQ
ncbi:unnamed protein product [Urochloa decumbens]|uniref:Cytochrome P450 n=1 Tax=Urochloa decumbens TaxID=240449 RepID=A0ABC8XHX5_9POAL